MARNEAPPFGRGETFYNGGTIDSSNLGGVNLEGMVWEFEDVDYSSTSPGAKPARSGRKVKCMCVRNVGAAALLPKRLVTLQQSAGAILGRVDGYARLTADRCFPVDEFLPAAGVPVNDLFWLVIEGPALCLPDLAGGANNLIPVGTMLVSLTAATSGATTAGRVAPQDLTGATAVLGVQVQNRIGVAVTGRTTANTTSSILVDVGKW